jgi:integrase/recombinase XerD
MLTVNFCNQSFEEIDLESIFKNYDNYQSSYQNVCSSTISERHLYLKRFFNWSINKLPRRKFISLSYIDIRSFLNFYCKKFPSGSLPWLTHTLRSFFNYCYINGQLKSNFYPILLCRHSRKLVSCPEILNQEQIDEILDTVERDSIGGKRDYALIILLLYYGIRGIQLRNLKLADINWNDEIITFPSAKNEDRLRMPLFAEVGNALQKYLLEARPDVDFNHVFISLSKPPHPLLTSSSTSAVAAKYFKKAGIYFDGIRRGGTHIFRHTFASRLLQHREPLKNISDLLGHRSLSSTMIYTKIDISGLRHVIHEWEE